MNIQIIRPDGDLKREVWNFSLYISWGSDKKIYFDHYSFQTKESTRHRVWKPQTNWGRLTRQNNTIDEPPLPADVEKEMREKFSEMVKALPITR
jgi:hypothetical protein